jgi:hypothetical protein
MVPVFYSSPVAITPDTHGKKSLKPPAGYGFARNTNSVPLNGAEFAFACRHYPIVFTAGEPLSAVAVLGLRANENLFVDKDGTWRADTYVPAYVRRFPFILIGGEPGQFVLGIEEDGLVTDGDERPFFTGTEPSPMTRHALQFCSEFQSHHEATQAMAADLQRLDLLVENKADADMGAGERVTLSGFRVIDEERLGRLSDEDFLMLRRKRWLGWIYCHLVSIGTWSAIGRMAAQQASRAPLN